MFYVRTALILVLVLASAMLSASAKADKPSQSVKLVKPENSGTATNKSVSAFSPTDAVKMILQRVREDTDSGVVTNQAVTVAGQDFYQHFMNAWRDKEGSDRYTLAVRERPSARWGSEVWVEYAQGQVFRGRLPISRAALKQVADDAAEISYQNVLQADARRQVANDADIAPDEF
jgi:curli production assembly/transport component CsgE